MSFNKLSLFLAILSSYTELHTFQSPAFGLCYITVAGVVLEHLFSAEVAKIQ